MYGPEKLANYKDKDILDKVHAEVIEEAGEGYRYTLNPNEKLCILSRCLSSQILPETELNALRRTETEGYDYNNLDGAYAFVVNHRGPTGKEITDKEIYESCNDGLKALVEMEILPKEIKEVEAVLYDAVLYSAIDVLEPRNNVAVWKVSMSNNQKNANKQNRLIDAYIDAAKEVCAKKEVTVCDCYAKWKRIASLGINVTELLSNKINHPTRKMNKMFSYELVKTMLDL